jgi:small conductance mechanosensitive channel
MYNAPMNWLASNLVSKRTDLRGKMLDRLHGDGIEIVSPGFMNQRRLDGTTIIPQALVQTTIEDSHAETLMFDKAELAGRIASLRARRDELKAEISALEGSDSATTAQEIGWRKRQIGHLDDIVATLEKN